MHREQRKLYLWNKEEKNTGRKGKKRRHGKQNMKKTEGEGVNAKMNKNWENKKNDNNKKQERKRLEGRKSKERGRVTEEQGSRNTKRRIKWGSSVYKYSYMKLNQVNVR